MTRLTLHVLFVVVTASAFFVNMQLKYPHPGYLMLLAFCAFGEGALVAWGIYHGKR